MDPGSEQLPFCAMLPDMADDFDLTQPVGIDAQAWQAITAHRDRLKDSFTHGHDRSLILGQAKELAEPVARVVITERGDVAPANMDFCEAIESAHRVLERQPGSDLSQDPELRAVVQALPPRPTRRAPADPGDVAPRGGIAPVPRRRRADHVRTAEREEISRGIAAGLSARSIAARIDRSPSTVSREVARNGGRLAYRAVLADSAAFARARRPKSSKLATNPQLRDVVVAKLVEDWSPQQIAQWLRREHPGDATMWVSHESIYRDLYAQSRKVFDRCMFHRLRSERPIRRPRRKTCSHGRGRIRDTVSIHSRPVVADTREVAGHWESQWCCQAA